MLQLTDLISSDTLKTILLCATVFFAASVVLLLLTLIIHKAHSERRDREKRRLKLVYLDVISRYQVHGKLDIRRPRRHLEYEALVEVCIDILLSVSGSTAERLREFLEAVSVIEYYKKLGTSTSWLTRYYAVEKLGFLRFPELKDYFIGVLESESRYEVKARALWSLSLIADQEILRLITKIISTDSSRSAKFNEYLYSNVIHSLRQQGRIDVMIDFLQVIKLDTLVPVPVKRDAIEACGSSGLHEAIDALAGYFQLSNDNTELKITCIRALGKLGGTGAAEIVMSGFADNDWRVRAVSAGSAFLCNEEVIPHLMTLMYDAVYFVRINASKSLAKFGDVGRRALELEADSPDKFVRDTARFILEEMFRHA